MNDKLLPLLDRLCDPTVEFDDIDLSTIAPEDLIYLLQAVRAWGFMGKGLAGELRQTLTDIDAFSQHGGEQLIIIGPARSTIH